MKQPEHLETGSLLLFYSFLPQMRRKFVVLHFQKFSATGSLPEVLLVDRMSFVAFPYFIMHIPRCSHFNFLFGLSLKLFSVIYISRTTGFDATGKRKVFLLLSTPKIFYSEGKFQKTSYLKYIGPIIMVYTYLHFHVKH